MIENERQYRITKAQVARLEAALTRSQKPSAKMHRRLHQAMIEGWQSQIDELRDELAAYENLKAGKETTVKLHSLADLPDLLIKARLARGYTQAELAKRLKLKPQQIQRYEATRYRSVSLARLVQIAQVLEVDLHETVRL
jgi:HTH-type transcriptional regulator/antitoxin HigA